MSKKRVVRERFLELAAVRELLEQRLGMLEPAQRMLPLRLGPQREHELGSALENEDELAVATRAAEACIARIPERRDDDDLIAGGVLRRHLDDVERQQVAAGNERAARGKRTTPVEREEREREQRGRGRVPRDERARLISPRSARIREADRGERSQHEDGERGGPRRAEARCKPAGMLVQDGYRLGATREDVREPLACGARELRRVDALATAGVGTRGDADENARGCRLAVHPGSIAVRSEADVARAADADAEQVADAAAGVVVERVVAGVGADGDDRLGQGHLRAVEPREVDAEERDRRGGTS